MSKQKYILLGVVLVLVAVLSYGYIIYVCTQGGDVQLLLDNKNIMMLLLGVACVFTISLGLGEAMFIRAQIVPKWLRLLFRFQWGVAGFAIVITVIYVLSGGNLG